MLAQLDISAFICGSRGEGSPGAPPYLSDLSWLTAFSSFFPQKVRFYLQNLANLTVGNGQISQWDQWAKKLTENSSFPKI